jgi:hypothetical protein
MHLLKASGLLLASLMVCSAQARVIKIQIIDQ